jgi:hypothetical protein
LGGHAQYQLTTQVRLSFCAGGGFMTEARNRATIEALVTAINARDLQALDKVFTQDVVMEWPQSGEQWRAPWIERM